MNRGRCGAWAKGFRRTSAVIREAEHVGYEVADLSTAVASASLDGIAFF